jgi:hypothetical protein
LLLNLLAPRPQLLALLRQPLTPFGQFGQFNDLGLIGVEQARFLPLQGRELALQPGAFVLGTDIDRRITAPLFILLP